MWSPRYLTASAAFTLEVVLKVLDTDLSNERLDSHELKYEYLGLLISF